MEKKIKRQLLKAASKSMMQSALIPYNSIITVKENGETCLYKSVDLLVFEDRVDSIYIAIYDDNPILDKFFLDTKAKDIFVYSKTKLVNNYNEYRVHYLDDEDFYRLNEFYFHALKSTRPFVTLSFGMSLDGKIATHTGDSKYISGSKSRVFVHELRNKHDAILVGINTVKIDHPLLNTRLNKKSKDPIRVILDTLLSIDLDEPVLNNNSSAQTIVVCNRLADKNKVNQIKKLGHDVIMLNNKTRPLSIRQTLIELRKLGIYSVLVEGGSTVHFSFIELGLFDRLFATISPIIIGGDLAKGAVGGKGFDYLKNSQKLIFNKIIKRGEDIIIDATPRKEDLHD